MPSAARSGRLPEPFTFFVDRSLGGQVVASILRAACGKGETIAIHDDHFPQDAPDERWLRDVGRRQWVVLTKDAAIRTNTIEREAVLDARVALFSLGRGDLTAGAMGANLANLASALPQIRKALRRFKVPLVATVTGSAGVRVLYAHGQRLARPVDLRPPRQRS